MDANYKIGLCYMKIGDNIGAIKTFQTIIDKYPNGEYYGKATEQVKQLSIE